MAIQRHESAAQSWIRPVTQQNGLDAQGSNFITLFEFGDGGDFGPVVAQVIRQASCAVGIKVLEKAYSAHDQRFG